MRLKLIIIPSLYGTGGGVIKLSCDQSINFVCLYYSLDGAAWYACVLLPSAPPAELKFRLY